MERKTMKVKKLDLVAVIISILLVHISLIQRIASWSAGARISGKRGRD